jgi:hypothetical protein
MRWLAAIVILAAWTASLPVTPALSQPPFPGRGNTQTEQQANPAQEGKNTSGNERGTESAPLIVQIAQPEGHEAIATKTEGEPQGYANPDWWVAGGTSALVVVTGGLWWVTYLLWSSTKTLVTEEANTRKIELRVYLSAKATHVVMEPGDVFRILVDITNSGQTPAFDVKIPAIWEMKPPPPHEFFVSEAEKGGPLDSLPSFTLPAGGKTINSPKATIVDANALRAIAISEKQRLYAFGLITYTDVFGDDHWVEYCVYLETQQAISAIYGAAMEYGQKIETGFMVPNFGNDASFNPKNAEAMKKYRTNS